MDTYVAMHSIHLSPRKWNHLKVSRQYFTKSLKSSYTFKVFKEVIMAKTHAGLEVMTKALQVGMNALNDVSEYYYENEAIMAWWSDKKARDKRAKIEKTFKHGRFSKETRTLGFIRWYGKWYCCFTQAGLRAKGRPLDK
ncbi:hypothetical protein ACROYT_G022719 [Oculina patagonica]